jgi:hypothetical protein
MSATSKLFNAGKKVSGATLAPITVLRFTAEQAKAGERAVVSARPGKKR